MLTCAPLTTISPIPSVSASRGASASASAHVEIGSSVTATIRTCTPGEGRPRQVPSPRCARITKPPSNSRDSTVEIGSASVAPYPA
ncbi:Uncharacterised protein [Mycobacteroides abscessus subsp. abscessus]|nr:Uncharacterised protein [Mycobacteroides abscessus subsp. abscessus]